MRDRMKSFVTGGAGFIGSNLVDALVERGDDVEVVDDLSTGRESNLEGALARGAVLHRVLKRVPRVLAFALAGCLLGALAAAQVPGKPMRIVLLVDSSNYVATQLTQFRAALHEFLETLPGEPEIVFLSSGGRMRIRVPPTTDRKKLAEAVSIFAPDGGANAFVAFAGTVEITDFEMLTATPLPSSEAWSRDFHEVIWPEDDSGRIRIDGWNAKTKRLQFSMQAMGEERSFDEQACRAGAAAGLTQLACHGIAAIAADGVPLLLSVPDYNDAIATPVARFTANGEKAFSELFPQ